MSKITDLTDRRAVTELREFVKLFSECCEYFDKSMDHLAEQLTARFNAIEARLIDIEGDLDDLKAKSDD